jgi:uncharacterized protein
MTAVHLDWFDRFLKPRAAVPAPPQPPVKVFVMGRNRWGEEETWPPERAVTTRLYLVPGTLQEAPPGDDEPESEFDFDPANPVPTAGGATFLPGGYVGLHAGPRDQRTVEDRLDVVTFDSAPFERGVELAGPVRVVLHAATSAADTDWTAKLVDVHPDGRALSICDGIVRARYRGGSSVAEPAIPRQTYRYQIELGHTSIEVPAGHALRVEISSSNFPRLDVNTNHGGPLATATEQDLVTAHQRIRHSTAAPSYLQLCILPTTDPSDDLPGASTWPA